MKPDTQAVFPGDLHAAPTYDGSQCLGARLHYAYREAMGHIDRDQSLYAKFPADEQAFWNRAAVGFVARLSDAPAQTYGAATIEPADEVLARALKAQPSGGLDWSDLEDDIADAISDSMDMDWTSRDGAKAVVALLMKLGGRQ